MAISFIEQLKKLDEQQAKIEQDRQSLLASAKNEAMKVVEAALADLNSLGYTYQLVEAGFKGAKIKSFPKATGEKGTRAPSTGPCPICKFETTPHHDARRHRSQPDGQKKPFTAAELASFGLTKI